MTEPTPLMDSIFRGTASVPRSMMPQIDEAKYQSLFAWLHRRGIVVSCWVISPDMLSPKQEIDQSKVHAMDRKTLRKPILMSRDLFILDGNHRWAGHMIKREPIRCYQIGLPFADAVEMLERFPGTYEYGDGNSHPVTA